LGTRFHADVRAPSCPLDDHYIDHGDPPVYNKGLGKCQKEAAMRKLDRTPSSLDSNQADEQERFNARAIKVMRNMVDKNFRKACEEPCSINDCQGWFLA